MKRLITLALIAIITIGLSAQELDSLKAIMGREDAPELKDETDAAQEPAITDDEDEVRVRVLDREVVKVVEEGDTTYVKIGDKGILQVIDQPDSTTIRVGDKEIRIVERNSDTDIHVNNYRKYDDDDHFSNPRFRGHWAGFEWGVNNFLDKDNTLSREGDAWFMDLNTGRSWAVNINFAQYSLGFGTSHIGLLTGLGLEFGNYFFDNDVTIREENDMIVVDSLSDNITKSKLTTTYLRVPLILEIQFPNTIRSHRVFLSAGVVAGLKLGSHTKVVYKDDGGKNKDKNRDDFNMNPFRYGVTARLGYGNVSVFGDYYFTSLFVKDKGPELHPFSVGLSFYF